MLALGPHHKSWKPPIITTTATTGEGLTELVTRLDEHWTWLTGSGELQRRRQARAREEITALAFAALRDRVTDRVDALAARVADGDLDPFLAAEQLLAQRKDTP
jgi:LAO/AO transport system kinase